MKRILAMSVVILITGCGAHPNSENPCFGVEGGTVLGGINDGIKCPDAAEWYIDRWYEETYNVIEREEP